MQNQTASSGKIEQVVFDNGTIWTASGLTALLLPETVVVGTTSDDTLANTAANEVLQGFDGNDSYSWSRGDGFDRIANEGNFEGADDTLTLYGVAPGDVRVGRDGFDAILWIDESAPGAGDGGGIALPGTFERYIERGIERIIFDQTGDVWTASDLQAQWWLSAPTAGGDVLIGFEAAETIIGGAGNDTLAGEQGNDRYVWAPGDGSDLITEALLNGGTDRLHLSGVLTSEVALERVGNDLILTITPAAGDGGRIWLTQAFNATSQQGVEEISFDDGTIWTRTDVVAMVQDAGLTAHSDNYMGLLLAETLEGGAGDDLITGLQGDDTYVWSPGDGNDRYVEANLQSNDTLLLHGVDPSDVRPLRVEGSELVLEIADSVAGPGARLSIPEGLTSTTGGIENIVFDDGTIWTKAMLRARLQAEAMTPGDDLVQGFNSDTEVFDLGPGWDTVSGNGGSDTYLWSRGDGNTTLIEYNFGGAADRLELTDVDATAVTLRKDGDSLLIEIAETAPGAADGGVLRLTNMLNENAEAGVETIAFAGGVSWTKPQILAQFIADAATAGDDEISGFNSGDLLEGLGGNDVLAGLSGNDTYRWSPGDGDDVILEVRFQGTADVLELVGVLPADVRLEAGYDNDLRVIITGFAGPAVLTLRNGMVLTNDAGVDLIRFAETGEVWTTNDFARIVLETAATSGDDSITGSLDPDEVAGLEGNDRIALGQGADTYVFRKGDGRDTYVDGGTDGAADRIRIEGYTDSEVSFHRLGQDSDDLIIRFEGSDDAITIPDGLSGDARYAIEVVEIADSGTTYDIAAMTAAVLAALATDRDDVVMGTDGDDVLTGGPGRDAVDGGAGVDSYVFRSGDGTDRFTDSGLQAGEVVELPDLTPADVVDLIRSAPDGDNLILDFGDKGRLIVEGILGSTLRGIEVIRFADGSEWSGPALRAMVIAEAATPGNEGIFGFDGDDELTGGAGADLLYGLGGGDTYRFGQGDGHDTISDKGDGLGIDRVVISDFVAAEVGVTRFYRGDNGIILSFAGHPDDSLTILDTLDGTAEGGIEEIEFADGTIWTMSDVLDRLENNAPVANQDGFYSVVEEEPTVIFAEALLSNDFDPDGEPLTILSVSNAIGGTVELDADGNAVFTALPGWSETASFDYTVSDGRNGIASANVLLRVRPPASALDDFGLKVAEDGLLQITPDRLLANDIDGDRMIIADVFDAQGGTVSMTTEGLIAFLPTPDYHGLAGFRYAANTPDGGRAEAWVNITVTPVNDAPTANADTGISVTEDRSGVIDATALLANDQDIDGDAISVTAVTSGPDITAVLRGDGTILLTPRAGFFGTSTFSYTVSDTAGLTATATVQVNVIPVNDPPVAGADSFTTDEDAPITLTADQLLANDVDEDGDGLTLTSVGNADGGTVTLFANGTIEYAPRADWYGQGGFDYVISDGQGGTATGHVTVQVDPVNDRPTARDESYYDPAIDFLEGVEDTPLIIDAANLLLNDSDKDSVPLSIGSVDFAVNGEVELLANGQIRFTPDPDFWGEASFRYTVTDGDGGTDDAQALLWFAPINDGPPVANDDAVTMFEDVTTTFAASALTANDTDIDNDPLTILSVHTAANARISVSLDTDGNIVVVPDLNFEGNAFFDYVVSDGVNGTDTGRVTVTVEAINDAPTATADAVAGTLNVPLVVWIADLMANDLDVDVDPSQYLSELSFVSATPGLGSLSVRDGRFIVIEFADGYSGPADFVYTIADSEGVEDEGTVVATIGDVQLTHYDGTPLDDLLIGSDQGESFDGKGANDTIEARAGDDTIFGSAGEDVIDGGEGIDLIDYRHSNAGIRLDLVTRLGQGGFADGDLVSGIENLTGTEFEDALYGNGGDNLIRGLGSDDLIDARQGDDTSEGGAGDDTILGGAGADVLDGGEDRDTADYSASGAAVEIDLAAGTATGGDAAGDMLIAIENLTGSDFDDHLTGDGGANLLSGGRGADTLEGGEGDDTLIGGRDGDSIVGGAGVDTASYRLSATGVAVDMENGAAGGGDAQGDSFDGIEIVEGSFHDDILRGDAGDNILRGGLGADALDGRDGVDTADYTGASGGVTVNLDTGMGAGFEAEGDTLANIENLIGSVHNDHLIGDALGNRFEGAYGNDTMEGAAGSDTYVFGHDRLNDTVIELGAAVDIDVVELTSEVLRPNVSLIREGDDLLIELERGEGFTTDTMRITNHFLGEETGIEEIHFADGLVWNRADIDVISRLGRFNAEDDVVRFADEDIAFVIDPSLVMENDTTVPDPTLHIISVAAVSGGTVTLNGDGTVTFLGDQDFFGDAFFDYTAADGYGRESTARVEVNVLNINDAPVAVNDGVYQAVEDTYFFLPVADILSNDIDVDGDTLSFGQTRALRDANGVPIAPGVFDTASFGLILSDPFNGPFYVPDEDFYGLTGFEYRVSDGNGGFSWGRVEIFVQPVNDAAKPKDDKFSVHQDEAKTITIASLLSNDYDPEGDAFDFVTAFAAINGTIEVTATEVIFTPDAGFVGDAGFTYSVADDRGIQTSAFVEIKVTPDLAPHAGNDRGYSTVEDQWIYINPADLLENDFDPEGGPITFTALDLFPENGQVTLTDGGVIRFDPRPNYNGEASFTYTITDQVGLTGEGTVFIDIQPRNEAPLVRDDVVYGFEDLPLYLGAARAFANDEDPEGDVLFFNRVEFLGFVEMPEGPRDPVSLTADRAALGLPADGVLSVKGVNGAVLPAWLSYDAATETVSGTPPEGYVGRVDLTWRVTETDPDTGAVTLTEVAEQLVVDASVTFVDAEGVVKFSIDTAYDWGTIDISIFDPDGNGITAGAPDADMEIVGATARLADGSPLPDWLVFDEITLRLSGEVPHLYFDEPRVTVTLTEMNVDTGVISGRQLTLNLPLIDERTYTALPGFRLIKDGDDYRIETPENWSGSFGLRYLAEDQKEAVSMNWGLAIFNVAELREVPDVADETLIGREDTVLTFTLADLLANDEDGDGDAIRVLDFAEGLPPGASADIYEAVAVELGAETRADLIAPYVIYSATLADGGALPDWLVFDGETLSGQPPLGFVGPLEVVVTATDGFNTPVVTALSINPTLQGTLMALAPSEVALDAPAAASEGMGAPTFAATLADGSDLPAWLTLDAASGRLAGTPPLGLATPLLILLVASEGATSIETEVAFDPAPAYGYSFIPAADYTGVVALPYTVTDDTDGTGQGTLNLNIRPADVAPVAEDDTGFETNEDTALLIPFADLLANDEDWDGDPIRIASVTEGTGGTVELTAEGVLFTPTPNTEGTATFTYTLTDDLHGEDTAQVSVEVLSTNQAPVAVEDRFVGTEDTVLYLDATDVLGNDYDPDGDPISLASVVFDVVDGRALILPDGRIALTPGADLTGEIAFDYTITDGRLESETSGRIVVDFAAVNDGPRPGADSGFSTAEDTAIAIDASALLANDMDVEGDGFTLVSVLDPVNGAVALIGTQVIFTPRADYFGNGGFSYVVEDVRGAQGIGTVTLSVLPGVDFPIGVSDLGYKIGEGESLLLDPAILMANDVDPDGGSLTFDGVVSSLGGTVSTTPEGLILFTGGADFSGRAIVTYRIINEDGLSATAKVEIDVIRGEDSPVTTDDSFRTDEDVPLVLSELVLLANDTDPDGHSFVLTSVGDAVGGTVSREGGNVIFTPDADWNGVGSYSYTVTDVTGLTDKATVTVTVDPVDDAPRATGPVGPFDGTEDAPVDIDLAGLFTDPEGDAITLMLGADAPSWLSIAEGRLIGTPPADYNGTVGITLIAEANGLTTSVETQLVIAPVADAPVATAEIGPLHSPEDALFGADLTPFFADVDGDTITLTVTGPLGTPLAAWLSFDGTVISGTPPADYAGTVAFDVTATTVDGAVSQTVLLTIDPVDDAPRLTLPLPALGGAVGEAFTLDLAPYITDPEGDPITFTATLADGSALPDWLVLSGSALSGTPPREAAGSMDLGIVATANGLTLSVAATIEIVQTNLPPVASDDATSTDEDIPLVLTQNWLIENDSDPDGDTLTVTALSGATNGTVAFDAEENVVFTPDAEFSGTASFT